MLKNKIILFIILIINICFAEEDKSKSFDYKTNTELSFMITGGNHKSISFMESGKYDFIFNKHKIGLESLLSFNKEDIFLNEFSILTKYGFLFSKILYPEISYEFYKNDYKKIDYRNKMMLGIVFDSFFIIGLYYTFEIEKELNSNINTKNHFIYCNLDFIYNYESIKFSLNTKYYKSITDSKWRLKLIPNFTFNMFKNIYFKLSLIYDYESYVSYGLKNYDYKLLNSIVINI